jgi:triacylglycerol lipase
MRPGIRRRLVPILVAAAAAVAILGAAPPGAAAAGDPVLLVHGWRGSPGTWSDMIARFAAKGRTAVAIDLPTEDNIVNARAIRDLIAAKGWKRVDLVGQSMGGLSARWYAKFLAGSVVVDSYVALGVPQYGVWSACALPGNSGGQMCPNRQFLKDLNAGDDTPGTTAWMTIASTDDWFVPVPATRLDGGACHVTVSGVGHNDMDNSAAVFAHVLAGVDRACTGTFK